MEVMTSIGTDLQTRFLASILEQPEAIIQAVDREVRESIEMSMLHEVQMTRLEQIRLQFMGLDGLMTERVRSLMGFTEEQETQLTDLQDIGSNAAGICQQLAATDPNISSIQQLQQGLGNVQNILIDQSINILNGAQIQIFQELCGEDCQFNQECGPTEGDENGQSETEVVLNADGELGSDARDESVAVAPGENLPTTSGIPIPGPPRPGSVAVAPGEALPTFNGETGTGMRVGFVAFKPGGSIPTNEAAMKPDKDSSDRR